MVLPLRLKCAERKKKNQHFGADKSHVYCTQSDYYVVVFLFLAEQKTFKGDQRIPILACLKLVSSVCSINKNERDMRTSLLLDPDQSVRRERLHHRL
jgi:hypothetical protein